jgi:hypothetical protein
MHYVIVLMGLVILSLALPLSAQNYDNPSLGDRPVVSHPQDHKPLGIRAGGFMLHPGVQLAAEFNDNVFFTSEDEIEDTIWHVRPYITAQSNWNKHALNVRLAADFGRYQDFDFRDYEDYFLSVDGRLDLKSYNYFSYNADYMRLHEDLSSRSAEQGINPTVYDLYGASLGYDHRFNRVTAGILGTYRHLEYENSVDFEGQVIDNQDRNRDEADASLRLGYQFRTGMQAFMQFAYQEVKYDRQSDRNGYDRSSDGYYVNAGLAFSLTGVLDGDVYASYLNRGYADAELEDVSGWAGGMGLSWRPTALTTVSGRISSGIEETTNQYSSGFLMTLYSLRVDHELFRNVQLSGQVSYRNSDYELIAGAPPEARSEDKLFQAGFGVSYFINRHVFLNASYDYSKLSSNVPLDEYKVNRVWLVLGLER